jgi:thiamine transport system ATP-binding protein
MEAGQIIGILGESGSGKSTMLDLISGFLEADGGSVALDNKELLNRPIEKRPITILFQHHNLFEHLSVETNILLGIDSRGKSTPESSREIDAILEEMGLSEYKHKLSTELSGGQQQRVALARALLRKKPILLLDEPFTGLDRETRLEMLSLVQSITNRSNLYTIMVTHEVEDCQLIADKVYKMNDGKLLPYVLPKES